MSAIQWSVILLNVVAFVAMVAAFVVTAQKEIKEETAQGDLDLPPLN